MRTMTRARKRGFGGHLHLHLRSTVARLAGRSRDAGNTRLQRMGAAACNLRSAGREQPALTGRRFALIRPRKCCTKERVCVSVWERQSQSQHCSYCKPQYCTSIVAQRVLCLNVTFPHRKHLAHAAPESSSWSARYPMCAWCTPTQRNLSIRARSQQTDLDGTMAPLGSAPATPPGARAESMTRR